MRNMSFSMTTQQVREQTKTVTRRLGWWHARPDDLYQPVEKCMGLKPGEKMIRIGPPIRIINTYGEPLDAITPEDVIREGFPGWTPDQFIDMLVEKYKIPTNKWINRIEFEYINRSSQCTL